MTLVFSVVTTHPTDVVKYMLTKTFFRKKAKIKSICILKFFRGNPKCSLDKGVEDLETT